MNPENCFFLIFCDRLGYLHSFFIIFKFYFLYFMYGVVLVYEVEEFNKFSS